MGWRLRKTIVLVGMMGAGKTAVGQALARLLGVAFLDSDEEIERAAARSITEIFSRDGEPFFREKERQVIARLLAGRPGVLSTGGGAFIAEANRQMIHDEGVSVWLNADAELLWQRVRHRSHRPLLRSADPKKTLTDLLAARVPAYSQADIIVKAEPHYAVEDTARAVIAALDARPDVLERK